MIANKLKTIFDSVEDIRDAIQEHNSDLGKGTINTLSADIEALCSLMNILVTKDSNDNWNITIFGDNLNITNSYDSIFCLAPEPPSVTFSSVPSNIYVPDELETNYQNATGWSTYSSIIHPFSDYVN